jgi:hypothetical protein
MEMQGLLLKLALNEFERRGLNVSVNEFVGRKNVQKLVYLLQEEGFPFGYHFRWYVRGPYSPALTSDFFDVARDSKAFYDELAGQYRFGDDLLSKINDVLNSLKVPGALTRGPTEGSIGVDHETLEATASARYLVSEEEYSLEEAIGELRKRKPRLDFDKRKVTDYLRQL